MRFFDEQVFVCTGISLHQYFTTTSISLCQYFTTTSVLMHQFSLSVHQYFTTDTAKFQCTSFRYTSIARHWYFTPEFRSNSSSLHRHFTTRTQVFHCTSTSLHRYFNPPVLDCASFSPHQCFTVPIQPRAVLHSTETLLHQYCQYFSSTSTTSIL